MPTSPAQAYHEYAIEKTANRIDFYLDGFLYQSYTPLEVVGKFGWFFDREFYLLLNVAVGGFWSGYPVPVKRAFPTTMHVDYIRVYDITGGNFGQITGRTLVRSGQENVRYCIIDDKDIYAINWTVPVGASFSDGHQNCINVTFGTLAGYVTATALTNCATEQLFSVPVKVEPYYVKDVTLVDDNSDPVVLTGTYTKVRKAGQRAIKYTRSRRYEYDNIQFNVDLNDADVYLTQESKFFMDVWATTSARCTQVILQLEDSSIANATNYPVGRHSRYSAFIENTARSWERLVFELIDQPDINVRSQRVDRVVLLFDPELYRQDIYFFTDLDSAVIGSSSDDYEPLPTNFCRVPAKSEEGACFDTNNNDRFGYDGDDQRDCDDADCWKECDKPLASEKGLCTNGVDDDENGLIDCIDPACAIDPACSIQQETTGFNPYCNSNPGCVAAQLVGLCCPSTDGVFLACCVQELESERGFCTDGIDNDGNKLIDCDDPACADDPACSFPLPTCASAPGCDGLQGNCCPTAPLDAGGTTLRCCLTGTVNSEMDYCFDGVDNDYDGKVDCEDPECQGKKRCIYEGLNPKCSENVGCTDLSDLCCPTTDGVYLDCCADSLSASVTTSQIGKPTSTPTSDQTATSTTPPTSLDTSPLMSEPTDTPTSSPAEAPNNEASTLETNVAETTGFNPYCSSNRGCVKAEMTGLCCPNSQGVFLDCCVQRLRNETGFCTDGIDNDGNGLTDCDDLDSCAGDPACSFGSRTCSANVGCNGLGGNCCPTNSDVTLRCCLDGSVQSEADYCFDKVDNDNDGKIDCEDDECKDRDRCVYAGLNPKCNANGGCEGLDGLCCPTVDGVYLDCCADSL